ncbi:hypothetical protein EMIHUDRAFT_215687 [Emiliania huxleyi CCMP1516]|uniref:Inosine/uridine-preferring nucleoside hydrolase domain-containing protein n=2 Tax=Emiliania huxleyi TaxID=2903 RepID=A0A0D3IGT2_EMIH1|nr:hypothetical protein EMIHUDRAFT_215687 [Emiliania huxleyi CCMP1516]EOD10467.1 hypothetical protein EMIHUDRAFT_215687 [Emiliania huxleyi CCMP1516]|eukprot:XP_005762896.1 hypothetical protein EMIHUDRAFT_215687 [Emiliania huxleyi CCMP1516]
MDAMSVGLLFGSVTFWNFGVLLWLLAAALPAASAAIADGSPSAQPVPVILDTDIGTFMDDSFALAMLLRTPHLVLKLLVTASHDVVGRARVAAKHLSLVGCDAVPIGIGVPSDNGTGALFPWAADYDLRAYRGGVRSDGVAAMWEVVESSPVPVALIEIGPDC